MNEEGQIFAISKLYIFFIHINVRLIQLYLILVLIYLYNKILEHLPQDQEHTTIEDVSSKILVHLNDAIGKSVVLSIQAVRMVLAMVLLVLLEFLKSPKVILVL